MSVTMLIGLFCQVMSNSVQKHSKYRPNWPFPQYDDKGRQLLPPGWRKRTTRKDQFKSDMREIGEALV